MVSGMIINKAYYSLRCTYLKGMCNVFLPFFTMNKIGNDSNGSKNCTKKEKTDMLFWKKSTKNYCFFLPLVLIYKAQDIYFHIKCKRFQREEPNYKLRRELHRI